MQAIRGVLYSTIFGMKHILIVNKWRKTMITERYSVTFLGVDQRSYTINVLADIWEVSAEKVFEETGIYVTGIIDTNYLVSELKSGHESGDIIYIVVSIRNPSLTISEEAYWNAYKEVIKEVRGRLDNPGMTKTKHEIDFYYFLNV